LSKSYAQQSVSLDLSQTATRYEKFQFLNRDAFQYQGTWQWHLTPRLSGALTASRNEELVGFEDAEGAQGVVRVVTNRGLTLDGHLFGGWHLLGGLSEARTTNSQVFLAQPDSFQTGVDLGFRYLAPSRSSLSVMRRTRNGTLSSQTVDLVNFFDSRFEQTEYEVAAAWIVTGRSTLSGRVTRISRQHERVPQRDFSGTSGELRYAWSPTEKLGIDLAAARNVTPFASGVSSSFRIDDSLTVTPLWRVSERLSFRMGVSHRTSLFQGAVAPGAGAARRDVYRALDIGANWAPTRNVALGATLRHERRTSSASLSDYDDVVGGLSVSLTF
jgi:exopolysaccharide biosynthesis operon protein EpsL